MKKNVGTIDKVIRIIIAAGIAYLIYAKVLIGVWAIVTGVLGGILILTTFMGHCGLYTVFGMKTCKAKSE